jgi:hypothetical protein
MFIANPSNGLDMIPLATSEGDTSTDSLPCCPDFFLTGFVLPDRARPFYGTVVHLTLIF